MATTKTIQATVKNRTDTAANWTQKNPVLAEGEIIVVQTSAGETRLKIGDGVKTFTQLPYTDEQIYNNVVTSVNGQTGDVTLANESKSLGLTSASVGQIPKVKAVDSNGVPTEWEPATLPSGGGTGTPVQSDWNQNDETASDYIKNRPFYQKPGREEITWDGSMDGRINVGSTYWLISNIVVDESFFIGATVTEIMISMSNSSILQQETFKIASMEIKSTQNNGIQTNNLWLAKEATGGDVPVFYCLEDNTNYEGLEFSKKGLYLAGTIDKSNNTKAYMSKLSPLNASQYKTLDFKYLPIATTSTTGTIKVGNGLSISDDGTLSVTTATYYTGTADPVNTLGADGDLYLQTEG